MDKGEKMAVFTIEISDSDVERVLTAVCSNYGRQEEVDNPDFNADLPVDDANKLMVTNPETAPRFANRMVRKFLSDHVASHERRRAKEQALLSLSSSVSISDPES
jgi:Flp pilus assembly CpaF family ATPase